MPYVQLYNWTLKQINHVHLILFIPLSSELLSEKLPTILDSYKYVTFKQFRVIKLIFYGTPRAGKTTLRKQLLRLVEGQRLQPCDSIEPSTNIAEMCDPIFVQRIVMTNEESNEWKWSTQKLDDIAKALLLCLDNKLLQSETERSDSLDTAQHENTIETLQLNSNSRNRKVLNHKISMNHKREQVTLCTTVNLLNEM